MTTINNIAVTIDTTVPTLSIGQIQLSADKRSTKETPLTDAQRIRRAVLPANHWGELAASTNGERNQSLTDILRSALVSIGSDRLRDTLAASPMETTINLADYTVASLLAWNAETASGRGAITFTREQVETWFANSATRTSIADKQTATGKTPVQLATLLTFVSNRFASLAAKNHGLKTVEEVAKLQSLIASDDLDGKDASLMVELIGRLDHIAKLMAAKDAGSVVSLDDL